MPEERRLPDFLEALGSGAPTPGGGAASALAGALAAALAEMVANFTLGRPKYAGVEEGMRAIVARSQATRGRLLALAEDDERAFAQVSAAFKRPRATEDERAGREQAIQAALHAALQPPLEVMRLACDVVEMAGDVAASGNATVVSDAGCSALLGEAAVRAAALNVLANVVLLKDSAAAEEARQAVTQLEEKAASLREHTMAAVHARMGLA